MTKVRQLERCKMRGYQNTRKKKRNKRLRELEMRKKNHVLFILDEFNNIR